MSNGSSFIAMSALDGLSDLAFDKGWLVTDADLSYREMSEVGFPFYTEAEFYLEFLQEETMPEEEAVYLAGLCTAYYEDNESLNDDNIDDTDSSLYENNFISPDIGDEVQETP